MTSNILKFDKIFDYLINTSEDSLYAFSTEYNLKNEIFADEGDYLGTYEKPYYAEDQELINYGIFKDEGTVIDQNININQYSQVASLQILTYEQNREVMKNMLNDFATNIASSQITLNDGINTFRGLINISEMPDYGDPFDANGADKFIASLVIIITFQQDLVLGNDITLKWVKYLSTGDSAEYEIPFDTIQIGRKTETDLNLKKNYENLAYPVKSSFVLTITGKYIKNNEAIYKIINYALDSTQLETIMFIKYTDTASNIIKEYKMLLTEVQLQYEYGAISSYTATFVMGE